MARSEGREEGEKEKSGYVKLLQWGTATLKEEP